MPSPVAIPAVDRYLRELELAIKGKCGVVPEDVLADTRDFLLADCEARATEYPGKDDQPRGADQDLYQHIVETHGHPDRVAAEFERTQGTPRTRRSGIAPGWRICCTRCGTSSPADKVGITRIGARSKHKYVAGWCSSCRRLRWMRLQRDLDRTNLCETLGRELTGQQYRDSVHRPWSVVLAVVVLTLLLAIVLPWLIRVLGD